LNTTTEERGRGRRRGEERKSYFWLPVLFLISGGKRGREKEEVKSESNLGEDCFCFRNFVNYNLVKSFNLRCFDFKEERTGKKENLE